MGSWHRRLTLLVLLEPAFIFTPLVASGADIGCKVPDALRAALLLKIKELPAVSYTNSVLEKSPANQSFEDGSHFQRSLRIFDLADKEANLVLFRGLQTKYVKGFPSPFARDNNLVSYSLSPQMVIEWPYTKIVLIAVQNILRDKLAYPQNDPEKIRTWSKVSPSTTVGDIAQYDEINVPLKAQNVQLTISADDFRSIVKTFDGRKYTLNELLKKVIISGQVYAVDCGEAPGAGDPDFPAISSVKESKKPLRKFDGTESPGHAGEGVSQEAK